jgi:hypothetical protein
MGDHHLRLSLPHKQALQLMVHGPAAIQPTKFARLFSFELNEEFEEGCHKGVTASSSSP